MSFKENLKNECYYQDIQLKELAARTNIPYGTLLSYVNYLEVIPNIDNGYKIAKELNVTLEYLITGNDSDKNYRDYFPIIKELKSLPFPVQNSIKKLIHCIYELNKLKE